MTPLISPAAMRDMEARYFAETGVRSVDLMERAALMLCEGIIRRYGADLAVHFACGPGGNGGDGYACARLLRERGARCVIISAGDPASPDARANQLRAREAGVAEASPDDALDPPDVWVDALYGTGLSRAPEGASARLIRRMNADRARGSRVVSVDIPSGLNGATGRAMEPCVRADATFAFQFAKQGCLLGDGLDMCGEIEVADIGVPPAFFPDDMPYLTDAADVRAQLAPRPRNCHKGDFGHLLIVAGSFGMAGAAALAAQSAARTGAGLVTVACPRSIVPILQALEPCAMCAPLPDRDGAISEDAVDALRAILPGKDAVACGCGLTRRASPEVVRLLMDCGLPCVFDADALNLIAEGERLRACLKPHHLVTPHPGEAARLLGRPVVDPVADAFALRGLGCQVLLKGAASVIPVGRRAAISASGGPGMARGGSGDCLTGVAGAMIAQRAARGAGLSGDALAACAAAASELHGVTGEIAQARLGARGMTARDIVQALPEALLRYE